MMKKILLPLLLLICSASFAQIEKIIPEPPNPVRFVVDMTGTLTADQQHTLEEKVKGYEDTTSTQIVVLIIPTTEGYEMVDYAVALGRKWGVGQEGKNNGIVFLIAKEDRKIFIAPGYGLEGAIPDITAKQIVDRIVLPNFKGNDFYGGIDQGIDALIQAAKGEFVAPDSPEGSKSDTFGSLIFFIIVFIILASRSRFRGGGGGHWTFGSTGSSWSSGGGGWSSGGSDSSSSFGGGSFGGGGAGGSW
jgi:uncharacterized protein